MQRKTQHKEQLNDACEMKSVNKKIFRMSLILNWIFFGKNKIHEGSFINDVREK